MRVHGGRCRAVRGGGDDNGKHRRRRLEVNGEVRARPGQRVPDGRRPRRELRQLPHVRRGRAGTAERRRPSRAGSPLRTTRAARSITTGSRRAGSTRCSRRPRPPGQPSSATCGERPHGHAIGVAVPDPGDGHECAGHRRLPDVDRDLPEQPHGVSYFSNATAARLPAAIAGHVKGIVGLTNTVRLHSMVARAKGAASRSASAPNCEAPYPTRQQLFDHFGPNATDFPTGYGGGPGCQGLTPSQTNSIYHAPNVGPRGRGRGVNLAVFELSAYQHSDIATWAHTFFGHQYHPRLVDVNVDGGPLNPVCPDGRHRARRRSTGTRVTSRLTPTSRCRSRCRRPTSTSSSTTRPTTSPGRPSSTSGAGSRATTARRS